MHNFRIRQMLGGKLLEHIQISKVGRLIEVLHIVLQPHVQDGAYTLQVLDPHILRHLQRSGQHLFVAALDHANSCGRVGEGAIRDEEHVNQIDVQAARLFDGQMFNELG